MKCINQCPIKINLKVAFLAISMFGLFDACSPGEDKIEAKIRCNPKLQPDSIAVLFWGYRPGDTFQVMSFSHGFPNGEVRFYKENGSLESTGNLSCGQIDGEYAEFHENGQVFFVYLFEEGKLMEDIGTYSEDGKLLAKGNVKNGNGELVTFYKSGEYFRKGMIKDGVKQGMWMKWSGGKWVNEYQYHNGINETTGMMEKY
jgi:hypothetical protein